MPRGVSPLLALLVLTLALLAPASAVTPGDLLAHPPTRYFNDYAGIVTPAVAASLNERLATFERQTSNQIMVVIFPNWPADLVFDDYAQDLFRAAKIGQQGRDNGVLVLVSIKEHKIRIHTGRGLEGALPDILCIRIIRDEFAPQFRTGNYDAGFQQGLAAIMAAAKGEYQGNGRTAAELQKHRGAGGSILTFLALFFLIVLVCVVFFIFAIVSAMRRGTRIYMGGGGPPPPPGGFFWGGGSGGGDGGRGSGGGDDNTFSGGGGDSGGGGASGDW
ncbi:MAG: TPM domain-containing protein [Verrucomicrobia bacterium]|nr:TPM domain-containing protein [Verrucomicrobiota bacterium]